jgi:hypothetical protein
MSKVKDMYDGFTNLWAGKEIPGEKQRILTCRKCPFFKPATKHWCKKCSCNMPAKVKAPNAKCPIKKW